MWSEVVAAAVTAVRSRAARERDDAERRWESAIGTAASDSLDDTKRVCRLFNEAVRLDVELELDDRAVRSEGSEADMPIVLGAVGAPPRDE